ncbi:hypothetical protein PBAL39_16726 [Pedobacter sp. BAL39]|uniref:DinB family protein n=1 Tax=Pedobacter sp. BAL39 TaxID=391596 RepID=UPI000155A16A|nr:DinB family protein [Pedobacter sp. BAL39]EDM35145.1 hypothetical protein PBAL39_16726 [Pedobacter sp. BAL39]
MTTAENNTTSSTSFLSSNDLFNEWLGHRRLTRRVIEAFPEDKIFDYSIGGMRTFADMVKELLDVSAPGVKGIITGEWGNEQGFTEHSARAVAASKADLLELWDAATAEIVTYLPQISGTRLQERILAFGMYEGQVFSTILYFIDNEIHHRAQGTVYLRSMGIEPPAFWNRD